MESSNNSSESSSSRGPENASSGAASSDGGNTAEVNVDPAVLKQNDSQSGQVASEAKRSINWGVLKPLEHWPFYLSLLAMFGLFASWLVPRVVFLFHTLANFHWQLVFVGVVGVVFECWNRRFVRATFIGLLLTWPVIAIIWFYLPTTPVASTTESVRILTFNVYEHNQEFDAALDMIHDVDADVVALTEFSKDWIEEFEGKLKQYPYRVGPKLGKVIYSKRYIEEYQTQLSDANPYFNSWLEARFWVDDQLVHYILAHTTSPKSHARLVSRNGQFQGLANRMTTNAKQLHVVVSGDFNSTTHGYELSEVVNKTGFKDSRRGFGIQNSWPTFFWPLGICIDHCFVSKGVEVIDRRCGKGIGSDHRPVIVDLAFATHAKKQKPGGRNPLKHKSAKTSRGE